MTRRRHDAPAPSLTRRDLLGGGFIRRLRGEAAGGRGEPTGGGSAGPAHGATITRYDSPARSPVSRVPRGFPVLRPPGAVAEAAFLERCTRCDDCLHACPHGAIVRAPARFREAAGTPMIDPLAQPCLMCADMPCIAACATGALLPGLPLAMGTAGIDPGECLAHRHTLCSTCVERCPVEGALTLVDARPVVDPARCTGCGICQHVCPAPRNAIVLLPARSRPEPPTGARRHAEEVVDEPR